MKSSSIAALAVLGIVIVAAVGQYEINGLSNRYNSLNSSYATLNANNKSLQNKLQNATATVQYLRQQLNLSSVMYRDLLGNYSSKNIIYQYPASNKSISIWGRQKSINPGSSIEWELLDTFDNHISILTNATANVMIMSIGDYSRWTFGLPYTVIYNSTGNQFHYDEPISEGCAGYVLVVRDVSNTSLLITPDVTATYEWTPFLTGLCG